MIQEELRNREPIVYQILKNELSNNRLAHAYLFEGVSSPLKLDAAFLLAQSIIENNGDYACEKCERCARIKRNEYYDLCYIDGRDQRIVKEDIEALFDQFMKTALEKSGKKVYIINNINHASLKVLNMILKFMEEPSSANIYGIFITDHIDGLLQTIVSRCQTLHFKSEDHSLIIDQYKADGFDDKDASLLAFLEHDYKKIPLNDPAFLVAKDMVDLTLEHLDHLDYLPILLSNDYPNAFKKNETDAFKRSQKYYLKLMLMKIQDAFSRKENELYKLDEKEKAKWYEFYQNAFDLLATPLDRKLLFDQLSYQIISYRVGENKNGRK